MGVYVSGRYAYVADLAGGLKIIDVSNPSSPVLKSALATTAANDLYVSGRYAYVADDTAGLRIIDIGGVEINSLLAGNIESSDITVNENVDIGNNLYVRNGINVGTGGIFANGPLSLTASYSFTTASTSRESFLSITQDKGYYAGDMLKLEAVASAAPTFFSGNFARFMVGTSAATPPQTRILLESSGAILASGAVQFGAGGAPLSSVSYSRFGSLAATHTNYISSASDVFISGDLEVKGSISANIASASQFKGSAFSSVGDCNDSGEALGCDVGTFSCLSISGGTAAGDTGEIQFNNADAFAASSKFFWDNTRSRLGIGSAFSTTVLPATTLEVQGTASASYFISSGSVQFGSNVATAQYSRFGSTTSTHTNYMRSANDLLISGDLEVRGSATFSNGASVSNYLTITSNGTTGNHLRLTDSSVKEENMNHFTLSVNDGDFAIRHASKTNSLFSEELTALSISSKSLGVTIGTPASPSLVGTYNTDGLTVGVHVSGKYAYLADGTAGG